MEHLAHLGTLDHTASSELRVLLEESEEMAEMAEMAESTLPIEKFRA